MSVASFGKQILVFLFLLFFPFGLNISYGATIIDHTCTDIWEIPESAVNQAKADLHIAYGHTSHGSQLISGMGTSGTQLDTFMTNNGATPGLYVWHDGPQAGALDLDDNFVSGDLGNPDRSTWAQRTRDYLDNPANSEVNVIIWSWCGQVDGSEADIDLYLGLMNQLEIDYPDVLFVYMTGHLNGSGVSGNVNIRNQQIRNYCLTNDKTLYDFADIESYDPDWETNHTNYMELIANDNCDYDSDANGTRDRNWALDWQNSHTEGVDWWASGAAHSQNLNGNLKGYAAWWLWARLAGWSGNACISAPSNLTCVPDQIAGEVALNWTDNANTPNEDSFIIARQVGSGAWDNNYATVASDVTTYTDTGLSPGTYTYRVVAHLDDDGSGNPCDSGASNSGSAEIESTDSPEAPTDMGLTVVSAESRISLAWTDNSANENGFIIARQEGSGSWNNSYATVAENITSYDDTGLSPGDYSYRVVAFNDYGDSLPSNVESGVILDIPAAPDNLATAGDSVAGTVSLSWNDNSGNEDGFVIQRQVDGGAWDDNYVSQTADSTSYVDNNQGAGRLPNATYTYRVAAYNGDGTSSPSNESSAVISLSVPDDPTDLDSVLNGYDVHLSWTDNSDNEEHFILERKIDTGSFTQISELAENVTSYIDTDLSVDHTYTYRVKASNNLGDSGYSNETSEYVVVETHTITLKQDVDGYTGCRDAYLDAQNPTYNYGGDLYNYVENSPKCNFAVLFEMPSNLSGKKILDAKIGFYCWTVSSWQENQYLDLYRITEQWQEGSADGFYQEGSVSWNLRCCADAWSSPGGTFDPQLLDHSLIPNAGYYPEFDIADLVQAWVDGTKSNNGVLLVNNTPVVTGIKASEYSEYGRPYLEITYTEKPVPDNTDYPKMIEWNNNIVADFGNERGVYQYDGVEWTSLSGWGDINHMLVWESDLVVDYGDNRGIYIYDGYDWFAISGWDTATNMMVWGSNLVVDFGQGRGIHTYDGSNWTKLCGWDTAANMVVWGTDLVIDFGAGRGIFSNDGSIFTKLCGWDDADNMCVRDTDLVIDFGQGRGVYTYDGSAFTKLCGWNSAENMVAWGSDLVVDFGQGRGIYAYNGSAWDKICGWDTAANMVIRDTDLVIDFGQGRGIYTYNGSAFTKLSGWDDAEEIIVNGTDLVIDYGAGRGIHSYESSAWTKLTAWSTAD